MIVNMQKGTFVLRHYLANNKICLNQDQTVQSAMPRQKCSFNKDEFGLSLDIAPPMLHHVTDALVHHTAINVQLSLITTHTLSGYVLQASHYECRHPHQTYHRATHFSVLSGTLPHNEAQHIKRQFIKHSYLLTMHLHLRVSSLSNQKIIQICLNFDVVCPRLRPPTHDNMPAGRSTNKQI